VLGGGVAGLTAADELSRRGYEVALYEKRRGGLGGKARGGTHVRADGTSLPAEHGFRCFPGSYRNVLETMASIPAASGEGSVADRLVTAEEVELVTGPGWPTPHRRRLLWSELASARFGQLTDAVDHLLNGGVAGAQPPAFGTQDVAYLSHLLGVVALADRTKLLELEGHRFADYACRIFAERSVLQPSPRLEAFLRRAGTRLLLVADPGSVSARTGLVTLLRLLNPLELFTERGDRVLPGPAATEWIDPWVADLTTSSGHRPQPVTVHDGVCVRSVDVDAGAVRALTLDDGTVVDGFDHVVCALPHRAVRELLGDALPPSLAGLANLRDAGLGGVQYYLRRPADLCRGYAVHLDSTWGLTSMAHAPFWTSVELPAPVADVLAVCVTEWDVASPATGRTARESSPEELLGEVWRQLCVGTDALPADRAQIVEDERVDRVVPVVVNEVGSWSHRPGADVGIANLFLAGDYVRTNADLATIESANESARRAVRALLEIDGYAGPAVKIVAVDHLGLLDD
jgi:hypothetical protein